MSTSNEQEQTLLDTLRALPPEKVVEVEDFVDFLCERAERSRLTQTFTKLSEDAFQKIWDNPDDAAYDQL
jgi:hypothetical protein